MKDLGINILIWRIDIMDWRIDIIGFNIVINKNTNIRIKHINNCAINEFYCPICICDNIKNSELIKTNCNHLYCNDCFINYLNMHKNTYLNLSGIKCAICKTAIKSVEITTKTYMKNLKDICKID
jgi:hypothetical protein